MQGSYKNQEEQIMNINNNEDGSAKREKLTISRYVAVPQEWFDEILPKIHPRKEKQRIRIELYLIRQTLGFHKLEDRISYSQFQNGIVNNITGKRLNHGCGYRGRESIQKGIEQVMEAGTFIKGDVNRYGTRYKLNTTLFPSIQRKRSQYEDGKPVGIQKRYLDHPNNENGHVPIYEDGTHPVNQEHNNKNQNNNSKDISNDDSEKRIDDCIKKIRERHPFLRKKAVDR